nr:MAG: hypothetical protein GM42_1430 [actinobacterium acMicro-1]
MRSQSLRGSSLNSRSLASDEGIVFSERKQVLYLCGACATTTTMTFAADAENPDSWTCASCGEVATLAEPGAAGRLATAAEDDKVPRTPFDMLLERRSREELEVILQERLQYLRARRGQEKLGA